MAVRRMALARQRRELLLAAIALQRVQLGLELRIIDARCHALHSRLRPWLARRVLLALAAALTLRQKSARAALVRGFALWRGLAALRSCLSRRMTP
jgi:hypothetical protein